MKNWLTARATMVLFMTALAVSIGSRAIDSWKDGQLLSILGVILFGALAGWFLSPFVERYLLLQNVKFSLWVGLSLLLGLSIWSFRPVLVTIPGDSIKIEALNAKNAQSQGYEANIVTIKDWNGQNLTLDNFTETADQMDDGNAFAVISNGEYLVIPGHLRDRGEIVIEFITTEKSGTVKISTGYKEKFVDLYGTAGNVVSVNIGKEFVNPFILFILYACDITSISLICLAVLILAYEASKRLNRASTLPDRLLIFSTYIYLAVPLILFAFGWLKIGFAILFTAAIGFGLWKVGNDFEYQAEDTKEFLKFFLLSVLVAGVWVYFSGIGGYTFQNWDFEARNAIFHDLIKHNWPVEYDFRRVPEYRSIFGNTAALVYYFPFWLPSALVGKVFGWLAANNMLYLWTVLGVTLCFNLIARFTKIRKSWVLFLFIFWSGMDILGQSGINALANQPPYLSASTLLQGLQIEWWIGPEKLFQYSAHITQLFWVFNQALPTWLVTLLVLNQKKTRGLLFTSALILLYAPLPAIGLAPFIIYKLFETIPPETVKTGYQRALCQLKEAATSQNMLSGGVLFATALLFFSANIGGHQHSFIWEYHPVIPDGQLIYVYVLFCLVEFIPFVLLAWDSAKHSLLTVVAIVLFVIPLYKYGGYNDFAMRASIPALLILCLLFVQKLNIHFLSPTSFEKNIRSAIFALVILFSAITPLHEIFHTRDMLVSSAPTFTDNWKTFDKYREDPDKQSMIQNFVTGDPAEKLFFKTVGK